MNSGKKDITLNAPGIKADIRLLTENLLHAYAHCITLTDEEERHSTMTILQHLKEDFEGYFATYIDRRAESRENATFIDMVKYYNIYLDPELKPYLV